jgi:hypothetical protein
MLWDQRRPRFFSQWRRRRQKCFAATASAARTLALRV